MTKIIDIGHELHEAEHRLLVELRLLRRSLRKTWRPTPELTLGQRVADMVAETMGSWKFIIIQSAVLLAWIVLNVTAYAQRWDPYPFILLNLALSFQAAYAAPFIMMSQNRQQDIDRKAAESDYKINVKAELEIELLHQKSMSFGRPKFCTSRKSCTNSRICCRRPKTEPHPDSAMTHLRAVTPAPPPHPASHRARSENPGCS